MRFFDKDIVTQRFNRLSPLKKAVVVDAVFTTSYTLIDYFLYRSTMQEFMNSVIENDEMKKTFMFCMTVIFMSAYYPTYSKFNHKLFHVTLEKDHLYLRIQDRARSIAGLPASLVKTGINAGSLYLLLREKLPQYATPISLVTWMSALPGVIAFLWGPHDLQEDVVDVEKSKIRRGIEYAVLNIFMTTFSINFSALYFWGMVNIPKKLEITNHDLSQYNDRTEQMFYYFSMLATVPMFVAIYIMHIHLAENMAGLIANQSMLWYQIKAHIRSMVSMPALFVKMLNLTVHLYSFLKAIFGAPIACPLSLGISALGAVTPYAFFSIDPLKESFERKRIEYTKIGDDDERIEVVPGQN